MMRSTKPYSRLLLAVTGLLICLVFAHPLLAQVSNQKGVISGQVVTADGLAAEGVTVRLTGTERATLTTESGFYIFKNLPAATYQVVVSLVGYQSLEKTVVLGDNSNRKMFPFNWKYQTPNWRM
jgi:iron complex outermembrane recepter protein